MQWTRRSFLAAAAAQLPPNRRPNVLVVMSDQESAMLPGPARLPNRDRLLPDSVRFQHCFCNTPQCSAARSSLLTGLQPHHAGVLTNVDGSSLGKALSPKTPTIGHVFQKAGYSTGYFGKWHLTTNDRDLSEFGFSSTGQAKQDDKVATEAADWIARQKGPWLAWVSLLNPHHIYSLEAVKIREGVKPPHSALPNLTSKPIEQREFVDKDQGRATREYSPQDWLRYRSFYLDLVEKVDANLGTVLKPISDLASTVVVYTSDHGDALGEHGLPFKGPFMYEELVRIPLLIHAPEILHAGTVQDFVTQADLAPTLAGMCGLRWPAKVDGRDLRRRETAPDAVFLEYYAKQKWKNPIRTIRTNRWKLNWYNSGHQELYDLAADPHEVRNLAGDASASAIRKQLEVRLDGWRAPIQ